MDPQEIPGKILTPKPMIARALASFIFTLGFHEDFILRRLASERAQPGNRIVVMAAKPLTGASRGAFQNLTAYCVRTGLSEPELVEIAPGDFTTMLQAASETIDRLEEPLIADLSGGMRILVVVVYTAIITSGKRYRVYIVPEAQDQSAQIEIETTHIEALTKELPEEKTKILETIVRNPGITIPQLARITKKSEKTIANHLTELKKLNLVITRGKTNNIYPTKLGELKIKRKTTKTQRLPESTGIE
ncbi:MAG: CRISPR-associated CARF protein Csa3 [Sulfolobales archaeon]